MSIADIRKEYQRATLSEDQIGDDPVAQFGQWFEDARTAEVPEVNAMTLATVNAQGRPSSRIVLIKDFDARGLTWFTHYASRKGAELDSNPFAALLFFWPELERQVRIEGRVEKISAADSDVYFYSRPLASQQGTLASEQSQPIASRALLEQRVEQISEEYPDRVPRPTDWGGYRLVPDYFEFWQGRPSRLHDRLILRKNAQGSWDKSRLQP